MPVLYPVMQTRQDMVPICWETGERALRAGGSCPLLGENAWYWYEYAGPAHISEVAKFFDG